MSEASPLGYGDDQITGQLLILSMILDDIIGRCFFSIVQRFVNTVQLDDVTVWMIFDLSL